MNKAQFIDAVAERLGTTKANAANVVNAVLDTIVVTVAEGEPIIITGFGSFKRVERAAMTRHNPKTMEEIEVEASQVPRFKAGQSFKDAVNK